MKILVFADSHTDVSTMLRIVNEELPDIVLHLGDHMADGLQLQKQAGVEVCLVRGNTDTMGEGRLEALLDFEDTRIYMTHGHIYGVETGLTELYNAGAHAGARIVLFGHTHKPYVGYAEGIWLMNPGRIGRISGKIIHSTYGVIRLENNRIRCEIAEAGA